jgi:hypothetical protein
MESALREGPAASPGRGSPLRLKKEPLVAPALMLSPTVLLTVLGAHHPALFLALRRDPAALKAGQWWRVISPVLIQPDPFWATLSLFLLMAIVGGLAVQLFGWRRSLLLYLVGALVGHAVGELWQPYRAGCSVAGCGLVGGLIVRMILRGPVQPEAGRGAGPRPRGRRHPLSRHPRSGAAGGRPDRHPPRGPSVPGAEHAAEEARLGALASAHVERRVAFR